MKPPKQKGRKASSVPQQLRLPSIPAALQFRAEQMGWTSSQMAKRLGMQRSHFGEVLNGLRTLPLSATKKAFALGVPASILLQS